MRALVVERSREITGTLAGTGFAHVRVGDLRQAAQALFGEGPELVMTAADLPDGSVLELIYLARQSPRRPPVVVVGKKPSREAWCRYVAAGAHHHVVAAQLPAVIGELAARGVQHAQDLAGLDGPSQVHLVDLGAVVRDVIETLEHAFPPGVRIVAELTERHVMGARSDLEMLVANLLVNGVDAMPEGGALHVRVRPYGNSSVLEVIDDGEPPPTWLGLDVAHRVLERHRGVLRLAPHGARGTAVSVVLPPRV